MLGRGVMNIFKAVKMAGLGLAAMILGACVATQTSGPVLNAGPILSRLIGSNVLMDDPGVLMLYATQYCNVAAAQEYRLTVAACEGQLASVAGGLIVPANVQSGVELGCQVLGYTNAS